MLPRLAQLLAVATLLLWRPPVAAHAGDSPSPAPCDLRACTALLSIDHAGIYRISGSYLRRHGFGWSHVLGRDLAVQHQGKPVPRFVSTPGLLGGNSYVEFYAPSFHTRYTTRAMYTFSASQAHARNASTLPARPGGSAPPTSFLARYVESQRTLYDPGAPGEGWVYTQLATTGDRVDTSATVHLPGSVSAGSATLSVAVRGVTDLAGEGPQHHLQVAVNGHTVLDRTFSGTNEQTIEAPVPASSLDAQKTVVKFVLPGDVHNQYNTDIVEIRTFGITYPRSFRTRTGALAVQVHGQSDVVVDGLRQPQVSIWRISPGAPARLTALHTVRSADGFAVTFAAGEGSYAVADASALRQPAGIVRAPDTAYLEQGRAALLIIAPRAFFSPLQPLVTYHRAHGTSVKLADTADVFARYAGGVFDPSAIRSYIRGAVQRLGTRSVLLVGGDTYDYHRYLGCKSDSCPANPADVSIVPSFYVQDTYFGQIPSDEQLVDSATGPTVAIGRIPAVNVAQVRAAVSKTVTVLLAGPSQRHALLATGGGDPYFDQSSAALAGLLPPAYTSQQVSVSLAGSRKARAQLLQGINAGAMLVNYVGHGSLEQWGQPPALLTVDDVPRLANTRPAAFLGWGCQTAYHVDPGDASLNARLLFAPHGAFLALGSTGLDLPQPQTALASAFFRELFSDQGVSTVGEALRRAEAGMVSSGPQAQAVVASYELFGDPAVPVTIVRGK